MSVRIRLRRRADDLRDAARAYADPLQCRIIPSHTIDSKPMPAEWAPGKRLGFEVRVRPIVRRTDKADTRPGKEWDAFQLEAEQHPRGEMARSREEVYTDWLRKQFEIRGGATLESAVLAAFQRTRAVRRLRGAYSEGPDALMRGTLEVNRRVGLRQTAGPWRRAAPCLRLRDAAVAASGSARRHPDLIGQRTLTTEYPSPSAGEGRRRTC